MLLTAAPIAPESQLWFLALADTQPTPAAASLRAKLRAKSSPSMSFTPLLNASPANTSTKEVHGLLISLRCFKVVNLHSLSVKKGESKLSFSFLYWKDGLYVLNEINKIYSKAIFCIL